MIKFEWDDRKDRANQRKHAVSFDEARTVFFDEFAIEFYDDPSSAKEERFLMLGMSLRARIGIFNGRYCFRHSDVGVPC